MKRYELTFIPPSGFTHFRHWLASRDRDWNEDERGVGYYLYWTFCGITLVQCVEYGRYGNS